LGVFFELNIMESLADYLRQATAGAAFDGKKISGCVVGLALAVTFCYYRKQRNKGRRRRRTVSFTSMGLALNSFPKAAQVPDPIINSACYFTADCPEQDAIAKEIVEPLLEYERFSHVLDLQTHSFRPSRRNFRASDLVREVTIRGDENLTHETIFEHLQDPLKENRGDLPWWEILVVRNQGRGTSACVLRVHHALADGLSLVSAFQKILTTQDGISISDLAATSSAGSVTVRKNKKDKNLLAVLSSLVAATFHVLTLGATKYDDDTAFSKGNHAQMKHSGKRNFVVFPTIPLAFVKELKMVAKVTVNDILMTVVSQAIHDYCISQNDPVLAAKGADVKCRALLPVGFPRPADELQDKTTAMSNKWCMVSCDVGAGFADIIDRLSFIHARTTEMKEKPRAFMQLKIQNGVAPLLPRNLLRQTAFDVFSRHSLVLTNVPGPDQKCVFAGKVIDGTQLFFDNLLNQVDFLSYAGQVYGNIIYDPGALPDFQEFGQYYAQAFLQLSVRLKVKAPPELQVPTSLRN
jgi:hypothetical protein